MKANKRTRTANHVRCINGVNPNTETKCEGRIYKMTKGIHIDIRLLV